MDIQKNTVKGVYWTKRVALCQSEEKNTRILASQILGDVYSKGDVIPKNVYEASRWYMLAKSLN